MLTINEVLKAMLTNATEQVLEEHKSNPVTLKHSVGDASKSYFWFQHEGISYTYNNFICGVNIICDKEKPDNVIAVQFFEGEYYKNLEGNAPHKSYFWVQDGYGKFLNVPVEENQTTDTFYNPEDVTEMLTKLNQVWHNK